MLEVLIAVTCAETHMHGCISGKLLSTCVNLTDSGFEPRLVCQKVGTTTTLPSGWFFNSLSSFQLQLQLHIKDFQLHSKNSNYGYFFKV